MRTQNGQQADSRSSWSEIAILLWLVLLAFTLAGIVSACASAPTSEGLSDTSASSADQPTILPNITEPLTDEPASAPDAPVSPSDSPAAQPEATVAITGTSPAETAVPVAGELRATVVAGLPPTPTPDASGSTPWGDVGVGVLSLSGADGDPALWAVYTQGMGWYDPEQRHFVAIYTHNGQDWLELDRVVLTSCAEYVGPGSLTRVEVEPSRTWLELKSGTGAHSGCYDLLSFDGEVLRLEVSNWHSSPGAGWLEDLDGDGRLDVILNLTEDYVFYYASGLRYPRFEVLRWDGERFVAVRLLALPRDEPSQAQRLNNHAVELAQAGLWKDASQVIDEASAAKAPDPRDQDTVLWNSLLIGLQAEALASQVDTGFYPLLDHAFYGDYAAAVDAMRSYSADEIWGPQTPLVVGTVAEGWEFELSTWISQTTTLALHAQPDLAAALFLRGWGAHLETPGSAQTVADVERAAELAPDDPLFVQSAAFLQVPISVAPPGQIGGYQPLPPGSCYDLGQLMMQTLYMTVTLEEASLEDPLHGIHGTGCRATATGTGLDFENLAAVSSDVRTMLARQSWDEDLTYAADGPTGTSTAFRRGSDVCFLAAEWSPSETADCLPDQPISVCDLDPEEQVYTVTLTCARPDGATLQPGPTTTPTGTATPAAEAAWQVRSLLVGSGEPGRLYALQVDESSGAWPATRARLLTSDDNGQSWAPFSGGLPAEDCVRNLNLDYAALPLRGEADALYSSTCQGLFRWTGTAWARISSRETGMAAVVYGRPEVIWATETFPDGGGVIRSEDGGVTWAPSSSGLLSFNGVANLAIDPRDANSLYAIIWPKYAGSYLRRGTAAGLWNTMPTPKEDSVIDTGMTIDGATGALYVIVTSPNAQLWRTSNPRVPDLNDVRWELVHDFGRDVQVRLLASGSGQEDLVLYANLWPLEWKDENLAEVGEPALHRSLDGGQSWAPLPVQ